MLKRSFEFVSLYFDPQKSSPELEKKVLTPAELKTISNACEKRRSEFTAARFCAKKAYFKLSESPENFTSLEIYKDRFGAPFYCDGRFNVSISHDGKIAAAITTNKENLSCALDIQKISVENSKIIYKFVNEKEKALIDSNFENLGFDFCCGSVFSAKEAMSKLFGFGFSVFDVLEAVKLEKSEDEVLVQFKNLKGFKVLIREFEGYIFAFASSSKDIECFNCKNLIIKPEII